MPPSSLELFAFFMLTGIFLTLLLVPETKQKTLETLSNEPQNEFIGGVAGQPQ